MAVEIISVRFEVLMEVAVESVMFRDMVLCNLVAVHRRFGGNLCLHFQRQRINQASNQQETRRKKRTAIVSYWLIFGLLFDPEDGSSTYLRNVEEILPEYMELHILHT
jgi:hypothetical protein